MTIRYYCFEAWDPNKSKKALVKLPVSDEHDFFDPILAGFIYDTAWRTMRELVGENMERFRLVRAFTTDFITGNEIDDEIPEGLFDGSQEEA